MKKKKNREVVNAIIKMCDQIYEDTWDVCEILNENLQEVFTKETKFENGNGVKSFQRMKNVKVDIGEIIGLSQSLDGK